MAGDTNVNITIKAKDKASGVLKGVGKSLGRIGEIAAGIVAGQAILAIGKQLLSIGGMAKEAASNAERTTFFFKKFGDVASGSLDKLRKASKGTISDIDLMGTANKAALLGVTDSLDDMSQLMVTARLRGKAMGLSTTQAFDDIVTGIGRGSPLILDNLGIKIPGAIKDMMEGMSDAEKSQILLSFAMKDGAALAKELGGDVLTTADKFAIFDASVANLKQRFGELLIPIGLFVTSVLSKLVKFVDKIIDAFNSLRSEIGEGIEGIGKEFQEILTIFGITEGAIGKLVSKGIEILVNAFVDVLRVVNTVIRGFKALLKLVIQGDFTSEFGKMFNINEDAPIIGTILRIREGIMALFDLIIRGNFTTAFGQIFGINEDAPIVSTILTIRNGLIALFDLIVQGNFTTAFAEIFGVNEDSPIVGAILKVREAFTSFSPILSIVTEGFDGFLQKVGEFWNSEAVQGILQWFQNAIVLIGNFLAGVGAPFIVFWDQIVKTFEEQVKPAWEDLKKAFVEVFGEVEESSPAFKQTMQVIGFILGTVLVGAIRIWLVMIGALLKAITFTIEKFGNLKRTLNTFKEFLLGWVDTVKQGFNEWANGLAASVNVGIGAINQLIKLINRIPGVNISEIGTIGEVPAFANGTQNFGGGAALVGEQGPELVDLPSGSSVTPADQTQQALGGTTIIINNPVMDSDERMNQLATQVSSILGDQVTLDLRGG